MKLNVGLRSFLLIWIFLKFFKIFLKLIWIFFNVSWPAFIITIIIQRKRKNQFLWEIIVSDYDSEQAKENKNSTGLKKISHNINKRM